MCFIFFVSINCFLPKLIFSNNNLEIISFHHVLKYFKNINRQISEKIFYIFYFSKNRLYYLFLKNLYIYIIHICISIKFNIYIFLSVLYLIISFIHKTHNRSIKINYHNLPLFSICKYNFNDSNAIRRMNLIN